jgi:hypothetical protein
VNENESPGAHFTDDGKTKPSNPKMSNGRAIDHGHWPSTPPSKTPANTVHCSNPTSNRILVNSNSNITTAV